jgi:hypothetical protein
MKTRFVLFICLFACLAGLALPLQSAPVVWNGKTYDDDATAKLITVIITTNPIPSIPRVTHLYSCQKSLSRIPALKKCKKIIVFDGVQPAYEARQHDYNTYKKCVAKLVRTNPYFAKTKLVFCPAWVHLSGAIKEAMQYVKTPYVFIQQHDFEIIKDFDLNGIVATLEANPNVKHVKLDYNNHNDDATWWNGPVDEVVEGIHFVPLTRTFGWSDVTHVAKVDYYRDFVLPKCGHGPMEHFLHNPLKRDLAKYGYEAHKIYGTYLYGRIKDGGYMLHTDGRGTP